MHRRPDGVGRHDPTYLLVAVTAESGITDLSQIAERQLAVTILAGGGSAAVLARRLASRRRGAGRSRGALARAPSGREPDPGRAAIVEDE